MLVRLRKGLAPDQIETVLALCRELGYAPRFLGAERQMLELEGAGRPSHRSLLEDLAGVVEVLATGDARELHQADPRTSATQVRAAEARFGAGAISLIAGPCAVEDEQALLHIARGVRARGATLLRGGAYKPRTSPYSFQGLGRPALEMLARVRAEVGIGVVTEVLDTRDVEAVAEVADMIQIGARSMASSPLLLEVGRTMKPVLLKRGFGATVRELLMAAEFLLSTGNDQVVLCERGVRSFDDCTRNLLDVGAVAFLARETHLPVIVDPSHSAGRSDLVRALARSGMAAGADGLIIEVHPRPEQTHSDGQQAISLCELGRIRRDIEALAALGEARLVIPADHATPTEPALPAGDAP
ncbi:MAG: 3-deoxy-7-phosphoheptulonate synthase [Planctomycetota bacterium]|jgi:3-deoxy-7-phosphoheptulonate synthase|nr:3-deoxy-7-phosphoheptulonate synthase [Planctomycetota bacterium]MDP6761325.1 3-deoxy-7-phosphoheptulonate synthase [Planctomycetota bacterium]MDP6991036.1 3-deoxy-7-phosphoheptulonate synthase [Planctomycetota bacterium]